MEIKKELQDARERIASFEVGDFHDMDPIVLSDENGKLAIFDIEEWDENEHSDSFDWVNGTVYFEDGTTTKFGNGPVDWKWIRDLDFDEIGFKPASAEIPGVSKVISKAQFKTLVDEFAKNKKER